MLLDRFSPGSVLHDRLNAPGTNKLSRIGKLLVSLAVWLGAECMLRPHGAQTPSFILVGCGDLLHFEQRGEVQRPTACDALLQNPARVPRVKVVITELQ